MEQIQFDYQVVSSMMQILEHQDCAVLGIDGLGGAGKSTVSEILCQELEKNAVPVILLHMDDFIHTKEIRYNPSYPEWQCYYELQWRYDYFTDVIQKLKSDIKQLHEIELYDKNHDCYYTKTYHTEKKTVIVVEGIFLQRKELHGLFDYMIYIDVPEEIRLKRVLKRDIYIGDAQQITDKYHHRYFPAEHHYCKEYHPDQIADYMIHH